VIGTLVDRGDSSLFHIGLYLRVYAYLWSKAIRGEPRGRPLRASAVPQGLAGNCRELQGSTAMVSAVTVARETGVTA
jgi:hypothetical protein